MMKKLCVLLALVLCAMFAFCCAQADPVMVTLSDSLISNVSGISVDGSVVTVKQPGDYIFTGSLSNGCIKVDSAVSGKVTLYLNGVNIHNEQGPAIQIVQCDPRCTINMMENSENSLSSGAELVFEKDDEPNGVIFSRSDLTITGEGALTVTADAMDGIVSKDDIRIKSGTISVKAPRHGIRGKDCVEISGGVISIVCDKDGIRSTNTKTKDLGYVSITGGEITIVCGDDPISAITGVTIEGGVVKATIVMKAE